MIALLPRRISHPRPSRVQRLVLLPEVEVDGAARILCRCADRPGGAGPAVGAAEHGLDARAAVLVGPHAPGHRRLALRAGDPLPLPVDGEVALLVSLPGPGLPARHT